MFLQDSICGCNNYSGCGCGSGENQFFSYTGGGSFPMKKGTRGEHVRALQVALNTKFPTPASLRIITPTDYWGDKTQALIEFHDLPTIIPNAQVLQAILEGKNPKKVLGSVLAGLSGSNKESNTGESRTTTTWKDSLKDPNQALGLFGKLTQGISSLRGNQKQKNQDFDFRLGQQDFEAGGSQEKFKASGNFGNNQQQSGRLPMGAWIAIGLVVLLFIGFLVFRLAK
jgi:hypothetical protein